MKVEESDIAEEDDPEDEIGTIEAPSTDNVGEPSVEINVEKLISELQAEGLSEVPDCGLAAKRRIEELMDRKRAQQEVEDFDDYDI